MKEKMKLPEKYQDKIIKIFEQEGKEWLNSIDSIIENNAQLYDLSDFRIFNKLSYNLVMTAISKNMEKLL